MNISDRFESLVSLVVCKWLLMSVIICVSSSVEAKEEKQFAKMKIFVSFLLSEEMVLFGDLMRLVKSDGTVCQSF